MSTALRQHPDLPEHPPIWHEWSATTAAEARERDLPLLVLSGCELDRWTAEVLRAIAADDEGRAVLDQGVVACLATPGERPGLDHRIQQVLALTAESAGWPALALFTPDGRPLGALPYGPWRDRDRRRGWLRAILDLLQAWTDDRASLEHDADRLAAICHELDALPARSLNAELALSGAEAALMDLADEIEGGFGPAPRSSAPATLAFLNARCANDNAAPALIAARDRWLDALVAGAAHDHLGGGFFRMCTDASWSQVAYDKRLLDQVLLAPQLLRASRDGGRPAWAEAGLRALAWALEDLQHADGGLVRGRAAESLGGDGQPSAGAAYAWTEAGAAAIVGSEAAQRFSRRFLIDERSSLGGEFRHPVARGAADAEELSALAPICHRLLMARQERPQPRRSQTRRPEEQAMALLACLAAAAHDADAGWLQQAERLAAACSDLAPSSLNGPAARAWVARALLAWSQQSGSDLDRRRALSWAEASLADLGDDGQLCVANDEILGPIHAPALDAVDQPSAQAVLGQLLLDLHAIDPAGAWLTRLDGLLGTQQALLRGQPSAALGLLAVLDARVKLR